MSSVTERINLLSIISRILLFSFTWWVLTGGESSSWWIGAPAILIAVISSIVLIPASTLSWYECFRFATYFFQRSLAGGIDVAKRALHPDLPIAPELVEYKLRLMPGLPRVIMVNTVSLLPGTLVADLGETTMKVHVLDGRQDFRSELEAVEEHVAQLFRIPLNNIKGRI